jgi:peptidoglycan/LPS O-acetylase OafA/YrhL
MAGNLGGLLHLHSQIRPLKIFHLWSISVEEQFYLVFPFLFRILPFRYLPAVCGTILLVMIGTILQICSAGGTQGGLWYSSGVQFAMFAAGILMAYVSSIRGLPRWKPWLRVVCLGAGCLACFCAEYVFHIQVDGFQVTAFQAIVGYLSVMLGCSLILMGTLGIAGIPPRILVYLGKISYGLYVFHIWALSLATYLIIWMAKVTLHHTKTPQSFVLAKDFLAFLLTILIASASYRWLEKPFLKLKRRFEIIRTRAA